MELENETTVAKRERAKKRVEQLKGFYIHALVYILVNIALTTLIVTARINSGENFASAFFSFGSFSTAFFWGIGLFFHGIRVFNYNPFFSKEWEKRKIEAYIKKDTERKF